MAAAMGLSQTVRAINITPRPFPYFENHRWREASSLKLRLTASFSGTNTNSKPQRKLILYTKPGCCLCDGLKEKLDLVFKLDDPDSLQHVDLQVRDITSNSDWERRYGFEIPVLARILSDGTEENLPRLSLRLGVDMIKKKLAAALQFD